jgi:HK97 family phage portal protein
MPLPAVIRRSAQLPAVIGRSVRAAFAKTAEGGAYLLPLGGGWIPASWPINFWQTGQDPLPPTPSSVVTACIAAYAQTTAMCPGTHWESTGNGGRERVKTSALSRILKKPNGYQSISDFLLNLTTNLYEDGNAYALALRNNRFEISELHLFRPQSSAPRVAVTGDVFYSLGGGNEIVERRFAAAGIESLLGLVPARDVLHVRLECKRHPLLGESPMMALLLEMAVGNAWLRQQLVIAANQGRPSGVIETELPLTPEQVAEGRKRWNDQTQGLNIGGTPILAHGMKWKPGIVSSRDAQLAELAGLNNNLIATRYRVPLALLSLGTQGPQASTEALMQFWIATGLGFCLNHIEEAVGQTFGLGGWPDDYLEFNTAALLRSLFKDRIEGLARGVQGGIYAPNEARAEEELPAKLYGDEPRVQQQVVPLSAWAQAPPATPAPDAPPPAGPADDEPSAEEGTPPDGGSRAWTADALIAAADDYDRHSA